MIKIKYILYKLSLINGTKQLLFGICLVLIGIWAWDIGNEGGGSVFGYICLLAPIIGFIFALSGLLSKDK